MQLRSFVNEVRGGDGEILNKNQWEILNKELCTAKTFFLDDEILFDLFNNAVEDILKVNCAL